VKQNNQPRELNEKIILMPLKRKTAKVQQETPEAQPRHNDFAKSSTRNKKINRASPTKPSPVTSIAINKNCGSPTGNLESPSPTKIWSRPTRNKTINRASSTKHFPLRRYKKNCDSPKAEDPESATPTQKCFNRDSPTKLVPVTTAPITKAAKAHQDASKAQLITHSYKKLHKPDAK
jgi:hypothetical protein